MASSWKSSGVFPVLRTTSSLMRVDTKSHRKSGTSSFTFIGKRCKESLLNLFPKVRQSKAGLNGSKLSQCSVNKH